MHKNRLIPAVSLLFFTTLPCFSLDFTFSALENITLDKQYQHLIWDLEHKQGYFDFIAQLSALNDDKYKPSEGKEHHLGYYFLLDQGGVKLHFDHLDLSLGRFYHQDMVDSPYALFISSLPHSALLGEFSYSDETFFYLTRWVELNRNSQLGYPDRGLTYKSFGFKWSKLRFGYQDAIVYKNESFNAEYFLNPLPSFFLQYVNFSTGKPWTAGYNANTILGFFADWTEEKWKAYAQILIDDLNANAIMDPSGWQNTNKIAWSLGGSYLFDWGKIGFYHAGATKYTFEPFGTGDYTSAQDERYGYTYYPDTAYTIDGREMVILNEDNYIGYYNGENNIAFLLDFERSFPWFDLYSSLELVISGSKSPANPYGELTNVGQIPGGKTKLLDSDPLEKKVVLTTRLKHAWKRWTFFGGIRLGVAFNKLLLVDVATDKTTANNEIKYFVPSDSTAPVFLFQIGASYGF